MAKVEKTVFISYRRVDISWALLVYHYLTANGFDVFFDYTSIHSGDFEQIIISNIKARAHFLIILTPTALDRCGESEDWLRREIETAISERRNIVPLLFGGFNFGDPSISENLKGELAKIKNYNGLEVPASYFDAAMERLCSQYLEITLDAVLHPISDEVQKVVEEQKVAANRAISQKKEIEEKPRISKKLKTVDMLPERLKLKDMEFCRIPAGSFLMGNDESLDGKTHDDEKPEHTVNIPYDYWMAKFPITNEQYNTFVQNQNRGHPVSGWERKRDHPVVLVSWKDAKVFCRWLSDWVDKELPIKLVLRMPTEAEWEKGARGMDGLIFPWGDTFDETKCNTKEGGKGRTTPVGTYSPGGDSIYGCADMSGNVWEWTQSLYVPYPYRETNNPEKVGVDEERVARGGSWSRNWDLARSSFRGSSPPAFRGLELGFRVVAAPPFKS
jgi:formylglycine-generating enzyme required for sulfatase activity